MADPKPRLARAGCWAAAPSPPRPRATRLPLSSSHC